MHIKGHEVLCNSKAQLKANHKIFTEIIKLCFVYYQRVNRNCEKIISLF